MEPSRTLKPSRMRTFGPTFPSRREDSAQAIMDWLSSLMMPSMTSIAALKDKCCICAILHLLCPFKSVRRMQHLSLRAAILVMDGIISELSQSIIACALSSLRDGNVGPNVRILDGFNVLDGSICHIASHLFGPHAPPEEDMPEEVEHRLIVHDFAWHAEHRQDNPTFASVHDVVRVVAQMESSSLEAHGRGIGIGGADTEGSRPLIGPIHLSLLPTFLRDPVVSSRILLRQFLASCL